MFGVNSGVQQADGGYWYIVGTLPERGGVMADLPSTVTSASCWYVVYGGVTYALVRLQAPRTDLTIPSAVTPDQILTALGLSALPYARVDGR